MKAYCIKTPKGKLLLYTIKSTRHKTQFGEDGFITINKNTRMNWVLLKQKGYECIEIKVEEKVNLTYEELNF